ncbi:MAG: orange carotenoid protein N-terminal domain-containing protein [Coleofasciculaceae cyanobacterium]
MSFTNYLSFSPSLNPTKAVPSTVAAIKSLNADEQLILLWQIYKSTDMGGWIAIAAPGAARFKLTEGLINQIKGMSPSEQLQLLRELANQANTSTSRAYGVFNGNNKLTFWYQLASLMQSGELVPVPENFQLSPSAAEVLNKITLLDFGRQVQVLRRLFLDMGQDPFAP